MGKHSKPWLNYKSGAPEREYPQTPKKKRSFGWALFWLLAGASLGAHRLYLWEPRKAVRTILAYLGLFFFFIFFVGIAFRLEEDTVLGIANLLASLLIVAFEGMRLRANVDAANKKYLLR